MDETYEIDMLIGSHFYWEFVTGKVVRSCGCQYYTALDAVWTSRPHGMLRIHRESRYDPHPRGWFGVDDGVTNKMLDATMRSFWELESLGIQAESVETNVSDRFASLIKVKGSRYEESLPWCECHDPLPSNYELNWRRLTGLLHSLKRNPEILEEYNSIIRNQLNQGVVELVKGDDVSSGTGHYLPHHAVICHDKDTTKVRVVYDASAKSNGPMIDCT